MLARDVRDTRELRTGGVLSTLTQWHGVARGFISLSDFLLLNSYIGSGFFPPQPPLPPPLTPDIRSLSHNLSRLPYGEITCLVELSQKRFWSAV